MGPQFVPFVVVTCWLRNRVPTIGFNNIFDFLFFQKSYVVSSFSTFPTNSQRGCVLFDPKSTKINNNKNFIICDIDLPTREVSQKSGLAFPCCMGSVFCSASHAASEGENSFLRHLSSGKVLLFIYVTRPQREA